MPVELVKNPIPPPDLKLDKVLANNIPAPKEYLVYEVENPGMFLIATE